MVYIISLHVMSTYDNTGPGGFFFWTRFENLVAKRRKINDRVVPILVAIRNWNDVICLSRSEKVAEFAQCVAPCRLKLSRLCQITHRK